MQPHHRVSPQSSAKIIPQLRAMLHNSANVNLAQLCTDIQQIENFAEKIAIYFQLKGCIHLSHPPIEVSTIEKLEQSLEKELRAHLSTLLMEDLSQSGKEIKSFGYIIEKDDEELEENESDEERNEQDLLQKNIKSFLASLANDQKNLAAFLDKQNLSQMLNIYKYRSFVNTIIDNKANFNPIDAKNNNSLFKELEITPILLYQVIANLNNENKEDLLIDNLYITSMSHHLIKIMYQYAKQKDMLNSVDKANFITTNLQYILGCGLFLYKALDYIYFSEMFPYITFKQLSEITRSEDKDMISAIYKNASSSSYIVNQFLRVINKYRSQEHPVISLIDILQMDHECLKLIFGYKKNDNKISRLNKIESLMECGLLSFEDLRKINCEELEKITDGGKGFALIFLIEDKHYSKSEISNLFNSYPELKQEIDALPATLDSNDSHNQWLEVRRKLEALPLSQEFIEKVKNGPYWEFNDQDVSALINEIMKPSNRYKTFNVYDVRVESINQDLIDFLQTRPADYINSVKRALMIHDIMTSTYNYRLADTVGIQLNNLNKWIELDKRAKATQHKPPRFN
jgi:hypothetical protein